MLWKRMMCIEKLSFVVIVESIVNVTNVLIQQQVSFFKHEFDWQHSQQWWSNGKRVCAGAKAKIFYKSPIWIELNEQQWNYEYAMNITFATCILTWSQLLLNNIHLFISIIIEITSE